MQCNGNHLQLDRIAKWFPYCSIHFFCFRFAILADIGLRSTRLWFGFFVFSALCLLCPLSSLPLCLLLFSSLLRSMFSWIFIGLLFLLHHLFLLAFVTAVFSKFILNRRRLSLSSLSLLLYGELVSTVDHCPDLSVLLPEVRLVVDTKPRACVDLETCLWKKEARAVPGVNSVVLDSAINSFRRQTVQVSESVRWHLKTVIIQINSK